MYREDKESILDQIWWRVCKYFPIDLVQWAKCNTVFCESHFYESYIDNQCRSKCWNNESGQLKAGFDGKFWEADNNTTNNSTKSSFFTTKNKEVNLFKLVSNMKIRCKNSNWTEVMDIIKMLRHEKKCRKGNQMKVRILDLCFPYLLSFSNATYFM